MEVIIKKLNALFVNKKAKIGKDDAIILHELKTLSYELKEKV
jgi:hypothetical protein